jgi:hypothetical protein
LKPGSTARPKLSTLDRMRVLARLRDVVCEPRVIDLTHSSDEQDDEEEEGAGTPRNPQCALDAPAQRASASTASKRSTPQQLGPSKKKIRSSK